MRTLLFLMLGSLSAVANAASPASTPAANATATATPEQIKLQLRAYFFDAAREGRQDMLAEFIRSHYDLNTRDEKGYTALILAAYHGHARRWSNYSAPAPTPVRRISAATPR